jgi:serine/threonine-protein kinase HipA
MRRRLAKLGMDIEALTPLDIGGEGRRPTRAHVLALGKRHGIEARRAAAVIEEVRAAVADWPSYAKAAGVRRASAAVVSSWLGRVGREFEGE